MQISAYDSAVRTAIDLWYEDSTSTKRRLQQVWTKLPDNSFVQLFQIASTPALAVSASPTSYSFSTNSISSAGSFSKNFVATASGGAGGYTYAWTQVAAAGVNSCTHSGEATATLTLGGSWLQHQNREYSESWQVTATDSLGASATFTITLYYEVDSGL